ncbi:phosphatidylserine decarboxylase [Orenia metallireducens]|uniref:Phosphatidylserine decarboxylase proenzyme n=1 Tax=Orenia metallireducens TaxID=1413210 RepID=A0A285GXW8_9FIRM|nr:phosphatidylserine decarboxylase family protein [Orenia metallireducens]PRX25281.1 phosphatidylserine decarboxylase [Orenia metallireducens]SNY27101.1 phosphatidylserine decarboxylase [Orenia metallireducens]
MKKFWISNLMKQLVPTLIIDLLLWLGFIKLESKLLLTLAILGILFACFSIWFFRNPKRNVPDLPNSLISPADGKIVAIKKEKDNFFFEGREVTRISIFLNVFNVHINRIPIDGEIVYENYNHGKFINAFSEKASLDNEQNMIGIKTKHGNILVKQIAGLIARRIISVKGLGDEVKQGQIYGMIKFGSRTDILIEEDINIKVNIGDKVKGGETIIGDFYE